MQRENNERGRNFERAKTAIIGNTYKKLISLVERYAQEDLPVLFFGETGTGKELFAELYFAVSQRRGEKKSVNCAQFRGDLLNSEVFGHKKGAFTGAVYDRKGKLKYCSKGILFLDELGASTPEFQAAILRVSEEHPYNPVGSDEDEKTETLLIAATSSLSQIREDLMYRFHILPVPPLQRQDIPMLAQHFLKGPPTKDTLEPLMSQDYPGNVRHLKRECQRLVAEKGKSVVCSTKALPGAALPINSFDYERYRQEVEMWNKHILPILIKYNINFKYRYFPADIQQPLTLTRALELSQRRFNVNQEGLSPLADNKIQEIIDSLVIGEKSEELLSKFISILKFNFEMKSLGGLLESLDSSRTPPNYPEEDVRKPNLNLLLNLGLKEATKTFQSYFLKYHLEKNKGNIPETAKALNMNQGTLKSRLRRLQSG